MSTVATPLVSRVPTQLQMFYAAHQQVAGVNNDFMWLVKNGMTREDLAACIERRPSLWARFEGFLSELPSREVPAPTEH